MGLALLKESNRNGVSRDEFEAALYELGDMARIAEQRLILKVDSFIETEYQKQKQEIELVRKLLMKQRNI